MPLSFPEYCTYVEDHFDSLKVGAMETFKQMLRGMSAQDVIDKAARGRKQYGGPFDVEAIAAVEEMNQECLDLIAYQAIHDLQQNR